jgi:5-methylcytosine-specific restriction endonuclease McrA
MKAADRKRYAANREASKATQKKWREANREARSEYLAEWRARHGHAWLEYGREYRKQNAARISEQRREYYANNASVFKDARQRRRALLANVEFEPVDRLAIYERDGGKCRSCGEDVPAASFELDHIVPLVLGGPHVWSNLQVLCMPCNRRKHARLEGQIALPVG